MRMRDSSLAWGSRPSVGPGSGDETKPAGNWEWVWDDHHVRLWIDCTTRSVCCILLHKSDRAGGVGQIQLWRWRLLYSCRVQPALVSRKSTLWEKLTSLSLPVYVMYTCLFNMSVYLCAVPYAAVEILRSSIASLQLEFGQSTSITQKYLKKVMIVCASVFFWLSGCPPTLAQVLNVQYSQKISLGENFHQFHHLLLVKKISCNFKVLVLK